MRRFQFKRKVLLLALALTTVSTGCVLLNHQFHWFSQQLNWPVVITSIVFSGIAAFNYRCPGCGKFPESDDVPAFDPAICAHCGQRLK